MLPIVKNMEISTVPEGDKRTFLFGTNRYLNRT